MQKSGKIQQVIDMTKDQQDEITKITNELKSKYDKYTGTKMGETVYLNKEEAIEFKAKCITFWMLQKKEIIDFNDLYNKGLSNKEIIDTINKIEKDNFETSFRRNTINHIVDTQQIYQMNKIKNDTNFNDDERKKIYERATALFKNSDIKK